MKNKTRTLIAAVALIALSACSSNGKILGQYSVKGEGATTLNRDTSGKSLSVVIRIFQLRDANEFSKLTFDTLAAGYPESELLGTSLLDKTDVVLVPGGTYTSIEKLHEDTRFIGIVGLFRNPDPHHWRQLVETRDTNGNRIGGLTFLAHDCHLAVVGSRSLLLPGQPPPTDRGLRFEQHVIFIRGTAHPEQHHLRTASASWKSAGTDLQSSFISAGNKRHHSHRNGTNQRSFRRNWWFDSHRRHSITAGLLLTSRNLHAIPHSSVSNQCNTQLPRFAQEP